MIEGARQLPTQHLTIRVPWHDDGWNGNLCKRPSENASCTILPRVSEGRDDKKEVEFAGQCFEGLERDQLPPCVDEHVTIMAPFSLSRMKGHPYKESAEKTHGHFADTPYTIRPYAAAAIPFRWMLREQIEGNEKYGVLSKAESLQFDYQQEREPDLTENKGWKENKKTWVQEGRNQRVILDTFASAIKPGNSLVFFYAKRTPMVDDHRRVIVGVGRVKHVDDLTEYRYEGGSCPKNRISGYLWERNIEHSIRPDVSDGFLLPYAQLLDLAEGDEGIDLATCTAFAPEEHFADYSYGSELLPQDGAIASLLALEQAIKAMQELFDAPWNEHLQWIDRELNRLWQVRGAFPGMGAALHAFGMPHGNLLAWHLAGDHEKAVDPWPLFGEILKDPSGLPDYLQKGIGNTLRKKWEKLPKPRRALLQLLSRFNLTNDQALRWYQETERENAWININDKEIIENPYRIYEEDRPQEDPIAFGTIDRGLFPPEFLRKEFSLPSPSEIEEAIDPRRVRAVLVQTLEEAASEGHTLLPVSWAIDRVRNRPMKPECPLDVDTLGIMEDEIAVLISTVGLNEQGSALQLDRYVETANLIRAAISKRRKGKRNAGDFDWLSLVNQAIDGHPDSLQKTADDKRAREEKAAALEELFKARVSVLMGSAGTGKSTLLKALCELESVRNGGILLLAPTGKARVRLEQASGMAGEGKTVAQFLLGLDRYEGSTGLYYINEKAPRSSAHKTVVIDECSMLTEEQLAALLDSVKGVARLILVGDPKQLPPIGAGRPYVDIVKHLEPDNVDSLFPRVAPNYAELTVTMRQVGQTREDVLLANAFCGRAMDAGADEVWHAVSTTDHPYIRLVRWEQPEQVQELLTSELVKELEIQSPEDEEGFEVSIGGITSEFKGRTNVFFNNRYNGKPGAAEKAEDWQILTPVRQGSAGVLSLNRRIQQRFRNNFIDMANVDGFGRKVPAPAGPEGIVYGDKVINVRNKKNRYCYPGKKNGYVANGDIGVVVGHRRTKSRNAFPKNLEIELTSQPGYSYQYKPWEFDNQESSPPLELAYALTMHKTQGSEFLTTFLVIPNPCRPLSREMLYTALTRHRDKVVILHQGNFKDLQRFSGDHASEIAKRMTNLFRASDPVEVKLQNRLLLLDSNIIYRTEKGDLVRSKSVWIIADKLHSDGIDYKYEQSVLLDGVERFPDFTIVDDDSGETWFWEHNGMLSNKEYKERWERKLAAYRRAGILPMEEGGGANGTLLTTEEIEGKGLDADDIRKNIDAILNG